METNNMVNGLPSDWIYVVKEAMIYRVYSDPSAMSDIIDIASDEVQKAFGVHNVTMFQYIDSEKHIIIKINSDTDRMEEFRMVMQNIIWRFCCAYKSSIEYAIQERMGRGLYLNLFNDIMEGHQSQILAELVHGNILFIPTSSMMVGDIRFF